MIYSGWQALYGTYCIGTNKLSIYHRYITVLFCFMITPSLYAFCGSYAVGMYVSSQKACGADITLISPKSIGSQGYVIDKPGTYYLTGDIYFSPDKPGRAALTIKGYGVTLLLDTICITQIGTMPDTHGIVLDSALKATIHGSTITGFTGNGIYASKSEALLLDSITCSQNAAHGFFLENCDGVTAALCIARSNTGKGIVSTGKNSFGCLPRVMLQNCAIQE